MGKSKPPRQLTRTRDRQVYELRLRALSWAEIALRVGMSRQACSRAFRRAEARDRDAWADRVSIILARRYEAAVAILDDALDRWRETGLVAYGHLALAAADRLTLLPSGLPLSPAEAELRERHRRVVDRLERLVDDLDDPGMAALRSESLRWLRERAEPAGLTGGA